MGYNLGQKDVMGRVDCMDKGAADEGQGEILASHRLGTPEFRQAL